MKKISLTVVFIVMLVASSIGSSSYAATNSWGDTFKLIGTYSGDATGYEGVRVIRTDIKFIDPTSTYDPDSNDNITDIFEKGNFSVKEFIDDYPIEVSTSDRTIVKKYSNGSYQLWKTARKSRKIFEAEFVLTDNTAYDINAAKGTVKSWSFKLNGTMMFNGIVSGTIYFYSYTDTTSTTAADGYTREYTGVSTGRFWAFKK